MMGAHIQTASVPFAPHHVPYGIVEHEGRQWVIREVDPENGWSILQRTIPESEVAPDPTEPEMVPVRYFPLDSVGIAACSVFLFLALMVSIATTLTFADVVGCLVGFLVVIWLLERRRKRTVVYERPDDGYYFID